MQLIHVKDRRQLDILRGKQASYGELRFAYTDTSIEKLAGWLHLPHAMQMILKEDEAFVAYLAAAETLWKNHLTVLETFVEPAYQRKGIGNMLLSQAIDFAKKEGLPGVIVQTEHANLPAQKLYEKNGFRKFENPEWKGVSYKLSFSTRNQDA